MDKTKLSDGFVSTILASIDGKYVMAGSLVEKRRVVKDVYDKHSSLTESDLILVGTPTVDVLSDIANQVRCYLLIDNFWRYREPSEKLAEEIHAAITGVPFDSVSLRATSAVPDYPGTIPTVVGDIALGILEIEGLLRSVHDLTKQSDAEKAQYLAKLFALVIRVHPFPDGNGRTARAGVQYCLRVWGYDYLVIPKVRNDQEWKEALGDAILGEHRVLEEYFLSRFRKLRNRTYST